MNKKYSISFKDEIKTNLNIKFGGQPDWITEREWPVSDGWEEPMMFLCQIPLDVYEGGEGKMAYLFVTHPSSCEDDFFDPDVIFPDSGENAVIIQSGGETSLEVEDLKSGPSLFDFDNKPFVKVYDLIKEDEPDFISSENYKLMSENERNQYFNFVDKDKVFGVPNFIQGDEWPDYDCYLLLQLKCFNKEFYINVGSSPTLFAFISKDLKRGSIVIQ